MSRWEIKVAYNTKTTKIEHSLLEKMSFNCSFFFRNSNTFQHHRIFYLKKKKTQKQARRNINPSLLQVFLGFCFTKYSVCKRETQKKNYFSHIFHKWKLLMKYHSPCYFPAYIKLLCVMLGIVKMFCKISNICMQGYAWYVMNLWKFIDNIIMV